MITHTISLIGKRESNEDQHNTFVNLNNTSNDINPINFFCIFDGHGGKDISKYLNKNLPPYFMSTFNKFYKQKDSKIKKYIEKVYDHIESKLEKKFKNISYNVGSTALTSFFYNVNNIIYYYVINVGDCRAVLCNSKNIPIQLTKDHKPNAYEERIRIEKLNGKIYYDGFDWRISDLSVSKSFGDMDALPFVSHKPDVFKYKLNKNDKFLILACDGLWDVISNQDACNFVLDNINSSDITSNNISNSNKNIAFNLANYAINNGSTDNVSIIIIFF